MQDFSTFYTFLIHISKDNIRKNKMTDNVDYTFIVTFSVYIESITFKVSLGIKLYYI